MSLRGIWRNTRLYEKEILITKEMVDAFGQATNDYNPIHYDEEFAKQTKFGGTIIHGMLTAGLISASLVDHYGPGVIYTDQTLHFKAPVRIGDTAKIIFVDEELFPKNRVKLTVHIYVGEVKVLEGLAFIIRGE